MTLEILFLFILLVAMTVSFMTGVLPIEITAFVGLLVLVFAGYVPVENAFDGFASPAVITMFSIFFISGALLHTGVADQIGDRLTRMARGREALLVTLLMVVAAVMSAFMNNVAATAVLLPAVFSVSQRSGIPPGRLFMPLAFGAVLGGTTTLIGTPPNILAAEVLRERGLRPFGLFEFTPIGLALVAVGVLYMLTLGRRLLPSQASVRTPEPSSLTGAYRLEHRLTFIRVPSGSKLDGATLREAQVGAALGVNVLAVERDRRRQLAPSPDFRLQGGDVLLVDGQYDDLKELLAVQGMEMQEVDAGHLRQALAPLRGAVLRLPEGSSFIGHSLRDLRFRSRFGLLVVGVRRDGEILQTELARRILRPTDELMVVGWESDFEDVQGLTAIEIVESTQAVEDLLGQRMYVLRLPADSPLVGSDVRSSRLGELSGLTVVGILREGRKVLAPNDETTLQPGDQLAIAGEPTRVLGLLGLGDFNLEAALPNETVESESVGVAEAVIAPRSAAIGSTLRRMRFRERTGLQVLALWRGGVAVHRDLADRTLRFGDALLLHGERRRIAELDEGLDFVILGQKSTPVRRTSRAPVALASLAVLIGLVASGQFPVHLAAFSGAVVAVLFGALTMQEAYRSIEWRALFLVAAVLPVGSAMESSGAANLLATVIVDVADRFAPHVLIAVLVVLASLLSQALDGAPTVVMLAPVVLSAAEKLGVSPYPLMMAVGLAASAAFMTPFSHKANLLVMSAGGYKPMDYVRVGTPLTLVVFVIIVVMVPLLFPL